jgi:hypothetical protein
VAWRLYTKADQPAVAALHRRMSERVGEKFELTPLDERPVLIGLVYEDKGAITHVAILEAQAEFMALGETALPRREWDEANRLCSEVCKVYDLNLVRAFVPSAALASRPGRRSPIERMLETFGFSREDLKRITPFTRKMA